MGYRRQKRIIIGLIFVTLGGIWMAHADDTPASAPSPFVEEDLGLLSAKAYDLEYSNDGRHVAIVAEHDGKFCVYQDGKAGPDEEAIAKNSLVMTPDGRHVAYIVIGKKTVKVVEDGKPGPDYDNVGAKTLVFSPDGNHLAYGAKKGEMFSLVLDGQPGPEFKWAFAPRFSPDGKRLAYIVEDGKQRVVVDGKAGPEYDGIVDGTPIFSPDSRHVAYVAKKGGKVAGEPGRAAGARIRRSDAAGVQPGQRPPGVFSQDGAELVDGGRRKSGARVRGDRRELALQPRWCGHGLCGP